MTGRVPIPTARIGRKVVPKLFLGDHGYLAKLDSTMTTEQVTASIARMVSLAEVGVTAGESRVVKAALAAMETTQPTAPLMIHGDLPLTLAGERLRYRRCAATLAKALGLAGLDFRSDPVLGFIYTVGVDAEPLDADADVTKIDYDAAQLNELVQDIVRSKPAIVTVGGDWLDLLLLLDPLGHGLRGLEILKAVAQNVGAALVLTTYIGALLSPSTASHLGRLIDGLMVPINESGVGMVPDPRAHWRWIETTGLPVIGMHLLAGSKDPLRALNWMESVPVDVAIVGASSDDHQDLLVRAAAALFTGKCA